MSIKGHAATFKAHPKAALCQNNLTDSGQKAVFLPYDGVIRCLLGGLLYIAEISNKDIAFRCYHQYGTISLEAGKIMNIFVLSNDYSV